MDLLNLSSFAAGYTLGMRPDGRELLVVVVKGTFTIPPAGGEPQPAAQQVPLVTADVFTGEPGRTSTLCESDYAPPKKRCDVLLNGSAYAPGGRPAQRVTVALRVGTMQKAFQVVGNRTWQRGAVSLSPSEPEFFTVMPVSYDNAFGGINETDPAKPRYYPTNHAGIGYHHHLDLDAVVGAPVPNTEEIEGPISNPRGEYRPMAYGAVGRAWQPRAQLAGTYDQDWRDHTFPFLPGDFQEDYYQAAPPDQQIPHPRGGEQVALRNLTPDGERTFKLPAVAMPVCYVTEDGTEDQTTAVIDTILLEPDAGRFMITWRSQRPLKRDIFEIAQVIAGEMSPARQRARASGRIYFRSLADLAAARAALREEQT